MVGYNYIIGFLATCGVVMFFILLKYLKPLQDKTLEE